MELLCKKLKKDYGVTWAKGYLGKLLKNPFYSGNMIIKGNTYPHRYPPIISKTLFDQTQEVKSSFKKKPFKYAGKPYIYRGLLRCEHCGLSITPEKHKGCSLLSLHATQRKTWCKMAVRKRDYKTNRTGFQEPTDAQENLTTNNRHS